MQGPRYRAAAPLQGSPARQPGDTVAVRVRSGRPGPNEVRRQIGRLYVPAITMNRPRPVTTSRPSTTPSGKVAPETARGWRQSVKRQARFW